jgi:hypothetical protein
MCPLSLEGRGVGGEGDNLKVAPTFDILPVLVMKLKSIFVITRRLHLVSDIHQLV